jgi:GTP-binding protein
VLVHVIDAYDDDVAAAYGIVAEELRQHDKTLAKRPVIVALNKTEGLDDKAVARLVKRLEKVVPKGTLVIAISAQSGKNLPTLLGSVEKAVKTAREKQAKRQKPQTGTTPVLRLAASDDDWTVQKTEDGFLVSGKKIELFAARTDFSNEEAVGRLRDIMRKTGIMHELLRQGLQAGMPITFAGGRSFDY